MTPSPLGVCAAHGVAMGWGERKGGGERDWAQCRSKSRSATWLPFRRTAALRKTHVLLGIGPGG